MPKMSLNDLNRKIETEREAKVELERRVKLLSTGVTISIAFNVFVLALVISQLFLG